MKKWLVFILLASLFLALGLGIYKFTRPDTEEKQFYDREDKGWEKGEWETYLLTVKHPIEILWYGEHPTEENNLSLHVFYIDEISDETLEMLPDYSGLAIVVNDFENEKCSLDSETLQLIYKYIISDSRYSFIYFGNAGIEKLKENGLAPQYYSDSCWTVMAYFKDNVLFRSELDSNLIPTDENFEWLYWTAGALCDRYE